MLGHSEGSQIPRRMLWELVGIDNLDWMSSERAKVAWRVPSHKSLSTSIVWMRWRSFERIVAKWVKSKKSKNTSSKKEHTYGALARIRMGNWVFTAQKMCFSRRKLWIRCLSRTKVPHIYQVDATTLELLLRLENYSWVVQLCMAN